MRDSWQLDEEHSPTHVAMSSPDCSLPGLTRRSPRLTGLKGEERELDELPMNCVDELPVCIGLVEDEVTDGDGEIVGLVTEAPHKLQHLKEQQHSYDAESDGPCNWSRFIMCVVGLQTSYLCWGVLQERVMTLTYGPDDEPFPSATFCVFSNRVIAILLGAALMRWDQGNFEFSAPIYLYIPSAVTNSLSSFGQYEALRYVSFPLQTISKATKVIPVMLMGKLLNGRSYSWLEYGEAIMISIGVCIFALGGSGGPEGHTPLIGFLMIGLYVVCDSFTAQYQSRVFKGNKEITQFQMMFATNTWAILFTLAALLASGEWWTTIDFIQRNPVAMLDNVGISVTAAFGQMCVFYTIKEFGPVVFTLIMTTRQMLSMLISSVVFVHPIGSSALMGAVLVFATLFNRARRNLQQTAAANTAKT